MKYKRFENEIVLVLTTDDDIHGSIKNVCATEGIKMGTVIGFGRHLVHGI